MMKTKHLLSLLGMALVVMIAAPTWAAFVVPGTTVNGTVDPSTEGDDETRAMDDDYLTRFFIGATGGAGTRVSFIIDLEGTVPVRSVGIYGRPTYESSIGMLSDEIIVEAAPLQAGPWLQIGSINVGSTRPTDPDPTIGGVNPFTGGNGRMIPCTPTNAKFLRISGDQGFDNNILIYDIQVNPVAVCHQMTPVSQGVAFNPLDPGGGAKNSRVVPDMFDGLLDTRTFLGLQVKLLLDLGVPIEVGEFRFLTAESDAGATVDTGNVRVSSTDDPTNIDTLVTGFDNAAGRAIGRAVLDGAATKRFFELELLTSRDGVVPDGTGNTLRISEIEYKTAAELPVRSASVVSGSTIGGTPENENRGIDKDYNTYYQIAQGGGETVGGYVIDLGGATEVHSVGMYGNWTYSVGINMLSDDIAVEIGDSDTGPWTQIGTVNVGGTRPTDPDPLIGGENPWTGGNGRRVPCTPTTGSYLRVTGGFGFDNVVRIYEAIVNPTAVLQEVDPVDGASGSGQDLWDVGGGVENGRLGAEAVDGNLSTRLNPKQPDFSLTLDVGSVAKVIDKVRFYAYESDIGLLPKIGTIRTSSTDDPTNMDTDEVAFNETYIGGGVIEIDLPSDPEKRFLEVDFNNGSNFRLGQIEIVELDVLDAPLVPVELSFFELQ